MARSWSLISMTGMFALLAYISLFFGSFDHIADDPGLGWHIENGALISEEGRIPHIDPFLAQAKIPNPYAPVGEGRAWISEQWLSDLVLYNLLHFGGWPLLYAVVGGIFLIAYFGVAADAARRGGQGEILVLLAVVLAFKMGQVHLIVRPVVFSILFFSFVLRRVMNLVVREPVSWSDVRREMYVLVPTFALWANLHPAFVAGLEVVGLGIVARCAREWRSGSKMVCLLLACLCATVINPYGLSLHASILQLIGSEYLRSMFSEWSPIGLSNPEGIFLLILSVVPIMYALIRREARSRIDLFEVLVAIVFVVQALWAVRNVPFASFACLPLWGSCFGSVRLLPHFPACALSSRVLSSIGQREARLVMPGMVSAVFIAVLGGALVVSMPRRLLPSHLGSAIERTVEGIFSGVSHKESSGVVLASLDWGGAITRVLGPRYRPVLDDRTVLVQEALYRAYSESTGDPVVFQSLVEVFGVTDVLISPREPLYAILQTREGWKLVNQTEKVALFSIR